MDAQQPTPDDMRFVVLVIETVEHVWLWLLSGGIGALLIGAWRASAKWQKTQSTVERHGEILVEQQRHIDALKARDEAIREELSDRPTKDDLNAVADRIQRSVEAGFLNMTQLITALRERA